MIITTLFVSMARPRSSKKAMFWKKSEHQVVESNEKAEERPASRDVHQKDQKSERENLEEWIEIDPGQDKSTGKDVPHEAIDLLGIETGHSPGGVGGEELDTENGKVQPPSAGHPLKTVVEIHRASLQAQGWSDVFISPDFP